MAVGGDRAIGRSRRAALDEQPCGTTLAEQDGTARTARSGLGERRARAGAEERGMRGADSAAGIGTTGAWGASRRACTPCATASSKVTRGDNWAPAVGEARSGTRPARGTRHKKPAADDHGRTPQRKHGPGQEGTPSQKDQKTTGGQTETRI